MLKQMLMKMFGVLIMRNFIMWCCCGSEIKEFMTPLAYALDENCFPKKLGSPYEHTQS
jgi:hypothetical protein